MKQLTIVTQGVRGGCDHETKQGFVSVYYNGEQILSVDNFYGVGDAYERRPEPIITIRNRDWIILFKGTHQELIDKLSK